MLIGIVVATLIVSNFAWLIAAEIWRRRAANWQAKHDCAMTMVKQATDTVAKAQRLVDGCCQHPHQPTASEQWPEFLREGE